jgi:hypothetical protein
MEMRIVVPDAASASSLAERLSLVVGAERISRLEDRHEVDIRVEHGSDRAILHVLGAVERWLERASVGSAERSLGDHSYRLARWVPVESWQ